AYDPGKSAVNSPVNCTVTAACSCGLSTPPFGDTAAQFCAVDAAHNSGRFDVFFTVKAAVFVATCAADPANVAIESGVTASPPVPLITNKTDCPLATRFGEPL